MQYINKESKSYWVKIFIAGDINEIKSCCRKYCFDIGLCVTVTAVEYIYTGGQEAGAEIGLINYPRFESSPEDVKNTALDLGENLRDYCNQNSFLVMDSKSAIWNTIERAI